ncbi:helicase HerA domain-containing protein [Roseicella sp. DB1501]|uniref:ATP-binding protein n=1 Tax=Roseicella sp. DB1501 TaxID=2730925 RepID=UPI0014915F56|nr:ATP-binding protein [Roseicella sp. DB1501]
MGIIPDKALEQHIAILGITGSGKTFAAKGIAESILSSGGHLCVIDPTGAWSGLRSSASGKKAGFPVVIFGGDQADVPLTANSGEAIAEIVATTDTSCVLDTGNMTVRDQTRFLTDVAETLYRLNRKPLHLIIDEAHNIMPQGKVADPQSAMMLHAANRLLSQGRSRGLRVMMISQRPQKLHKDSLSQAQALVAMRVVAPQDRKAIEDWIGSWADPKEGADMMASLPSLQTGEGWVWAPVVGVLKRVKFPPIKTYDSSKAPDGEAGEIVLAKIDLPAIQARLELATSDAAENDPKRLKARIAELEKAKGKPDADALRKAEEAGYARGRAEVAPAVKQALAAAGDRLRALAEDLGSSQVISAAPVPNPVPLQPSRPKAPPSSTRSEIGDGLPRRILTALAQLDGAVPKSRLALMVEVKASGGYFRNTLTKMRSEGQVTGTDPISITPAGRAAVGPVDPLPVGRDLLDVWSKRLGGLNERILGTLWDAGALAKGDLAARVGTDPSGGYFRNTLTKLRGLGLIDGTQTVSLSMNFYTA